MAGTNPSKVAARLSMAGLLLVVLLGAGASMSSSTVAITDATVALAKALVVGDMAAARSRHSESNETRQHA